MVDANISFDFRKSCTSNRLDLEISVMSRTWIQRWRECLLVIIFIVSVSVAMVTACVHEHDDDDFTRPVLKRTLAVLDVAESEDALAANQLALFDGHEDVQKKHGGLTPLESVFASKPSRESAKENLKFLTTTPHMAGTKQDEDLARWMVSRFKELGTDASWVDPIDGFLSYPKHRPRLAVVCPKNESEVFFEAKLSEDILPNDATSDTWDRNHTFNGYSASGLVKGKLVYANFGTPEDFNLLEKWNITVKNRIVIMRYGKCFRGLKVMNAQLRGAIGAVIFSDPHEDGYNLGATYPDGPWRPQSSVQRGSVQFNSLCAGDPVRAASSNDTMQKCGYKSEDLYPAIPVLPISWEDALPLLQELQGPFAPSEFVGSLQIAYKLGPSHKDVLMHVRNRFAVEKIWNAFAVFKGPHYGTKRDRPLVIGNHRDAWVFGAVDPNSGTACMLEVAKGFGVLRKLGWRPKRTILFASWSGEELGLLGSTAWGEKHAKGFLKNAVAYLNVDIGVSGNRFELEATATMARFIANVLKDISDPEIPGASLLARWDRKFRPLGTGSDFTVFIHHLGIPSVDMRFSADAGSRKATSYGVYHSIYDSFSWMEQFGDPTFVFHEKMSVVWGIAALRIADAGVLPFNHVDQARLILGYVNDVREMVTDPIAFKSMAYASLQLLKVAKREMALNHERWWKHEPIDSRRNDRLAFAERQFLIPGDDGLPLRKWFKHVLQAPDLYLGYSAVVIPGVVQAFADQNDPKLANKQALLFADRLRAVARLLHEGHAFEDIEDNDDTKDEQVRVSSESRGAMAVI